MDLFLKDGLVNTELTEEQLAEVPAEVRPLVDAVISCGRELKSANDAVIAADAELSTAFAAWEEHVKHAPKVSAVDAARAFIAS